jgi:alpha-tubulin suppressor-like RCC1 family protein
MVISSTGQISFLDLQNEFGGENPIILSEYYSDATTEYAKGVSGIPNIGSAISLSQFRGKELLAIVIQLATQWEHQMFVKSNGTVIGSGRNSDYQLGVYNVDLKAPGNVIYSPPEPRQVLKGEDPDSLDDYLSDIIQVSVGYNHTLFLKSDGTVFGCGKNDSYQLGVPLNIGPYVEVPTKVLKGASVSPDNYLSDIIQVSTGQAHTMFLKSDGTVFGCGSDYYGELGTSYYDTTNQQVPVQVLDKDGGYLSNIIQVSASGSASMFLNGGGFVYVCGYQPYGHLGVQSTSNITVPVKVLRGQDVGFNGYLSDIIYISLTNFHSMFLKSDGTVFACGTNGRYQLGLGNTSTKNVPNKVLKGEDSDSSDNYLSDIIQISTGYEKTYFLKRNGTVFACGKVRDANVDPSGYAQTPKKVLKGEDSDSPDNYLSDIIQVSVGYKEAMFLKSNGTVFASGELSYTGYLNTDLPKIYSLDNFVF